MRTLKTALLAGTMLAGLPGMAAAQDAPSFHGFYLGAHGGQGWATWGQSVNDGFATTVVMPDTKDVDGSGIFGGFNAGYDHAFANGVVLGGEADVSFADVSETHQFVTQKHIDTGGADGTSWTKTMSLDRFGTIRGRLGYAVSESLMLYGTGGYAWANTSERHVVADGTNAPHAKSSIDKTRHGYAVGGGAEFNLTGNWSLRGEYLFMDFGRETFNHSVGNKGGTPDKTSSDLSMHAVRAVLTRRFSF